MFLFELIWGVLADTIGLSRVGFYAEVGVEGFAFDDEF